MKRQTIVNGLLALCLCALAAGYWLPSRSDGVIEQSERYWSADRPVYGYLCECGFYTGGFTNRLQAVEAMRISRRAGCILK